MNAPFNRSPEHLKVIAEVLLWCDGRKGRAARLSRTLGFRSEFIRRVRTGHRNWRDLDVQRVREVMREIESQETEQTYCTFKSRLPFEPEPPRPVAQRCSGRTLAGGEYRRQCMACARWLNGGSLPGAIRPRIVDGRCGQWRPE